MHTVQHCPLQNHLLAAMPVQEFERLVPHLELVHLNLGQEMYESGCKLDCVYFPTTAIISMVHVLHGGACAETAIVGNEGILGISLFLDRDTIPFRSVVQSAGWGYRIGSQHIVEEFARRGPVMILMLRYTQALITQMAQTAVCNRHHSVDQQLCRWLLMSLDRLNSDSLTMTQELIANMLGVRREGVSHAAAELESAGYIRYSRGKITVLDRHALEQRVCECYSVVKQEVYRLLTSITPGDPKHVLGNSMPNRQCRVDCRFMSKNPTGNQQHRASQCQTSCELLPALDSVGAAASG